MPVDISTAELRTSEERQLCNYNKRLTRSQVPVQAKRLRTLAPEPEETGEL
eukprot:COSAG03_NODE_4029_length_1713_cov_6.441140_1_plen_51_part_00